MTQSMNEFSALKMPDNFGFVIAFTNVAVRLGIL
jgi:hypothetical protein